MEKVATILQLTDLHLFANPQERQVGVNPFQTLQLVIADIVNNQRHIQPDLIMLTGDVSQDYSLPSYQLARRILEPLRAPVVALMGNHDLAEDFSQVWGDPAARRITGIPALAGWSILGLNSHLVGEVEGFLAESELEILQENLTAHSDLPTAIFLHHHVLPVGSQWLDRIGVRNSQQFLSIIRQHPQVRLVVCGHVHQEWQQEQDGVIFYTTPATSWQFAAAHEGFKLDGLMPGYRWLYLHSDGAVQSEVRRLPLDPHLIPDISSKGY